MKKTIRYSIVLIFVAALLFIGAFFWASSSSLQPSDYNKIIVKKESAKRFSDSIFKIVTYNVGYLSGMTNNKAIDKPLSLFQTNLKKLKNELKKINADILALQEIDYKAARSHNVNQEDEIANLGYKYSAQAINWDKQYVPFPYWPPSMHFGKIISGQSVLSKFPIKSQDRKVLNRVTDLPYYRDVFYLDRLAQVVKLDILGEDVIVINIHLEAFNKQTRTKQLEDVVEVYKTYSETYPTVLLGDFNSDPDYKQSAIKQMFAIDGIGCAAYSKDNYQNTFSSNNPYERLDYIFYNKKFITYVDGKVLPSFGEISDHLPVEMTFKLRKT